MIAHSILQARLIRGVIFDMDGVLVDSEPIHEQALSETLAAYGHRLTPEIYAGTLGQSPDDNWRWLLDHYPLTCEGQEFLGRYAGAVLELLQRALDPRPGAVDLIARFRSEGCRIALASMSTRAWVDATLRGIGLAEAFDATVSADEVARGKPDPEVFLTAAAMIGVDPAACLVIEDAPAGVEAALRAGMRPVAVRTRYTHGYELPAFWTVDSLTELLVEDAFQRLLAPPEAVSAST